MITLADEHGRLMFSFDVKTDPYAVLHALAWSHPTGISTCPWDCPTRHGQYCLKCHAMAFNALTEARTRSESKEHDDVEQDAVQARPVQLQGAG